MLFSGLTMPATAALVTVATEGLGDYTDSLPPLMLLSLVTVRPGVPARDTRARYSFASCLCRTFRATSISSRRPVF